MQAIQSLSQKYSSLSASEKEKYDNFQAREALEAMIERKTRKHPELNFHIIDSSHCYEDLKIFIAKIIEDKKNAVTELPKRFQIIYGQGHRSGLDILVLKDKKISLIYIDAAAADVNWTDIFAISLVFESDIELTSCLGGLSEQSRIQMDTKNCAYFSFEQLYQASKTPNFHRDIQCVRTQTNSYFEVHPLDQLPATVRCAQSATFLVQYYERHETSGSRHLDMPVNQKKQSLKDFTSSHTREGLTNRGERKQLNLAAEDKINSIKAKLGMITTTQEQPPVTEDHETEPARTIPTRPPTAFVLKLPLRRKKAVAAEAPAAAVAANSATPLDPPR